MAKKHTKKKKRYVMLIQVSLRKSVRKCTFNLLRKYINIYITGNYFIKKTLEFMMTVVTTKIENNIVNYQSDNNIDNLRTNIDSKFDNYYVILIINEVMIIVT